MIKTGPLWLPRSGRESLAGLVWLPRLIDKGRRVLEGDKLGQDVLSPYMFGDNDYLDAILLRFLSINDATILSILRDEGDDAKAAAAIVAHGGRSPDECARWNARFLRQQLLWLTLIDADEGRQPPGFATSLMRAFYNGLIVPAALSVYGRMEARRGPR